MHMVESISAFQVINSSSFCVHSNGLLEWRTERLKRVKRQLFLPCPCSFHLVTEWSREKRGHLVPNPKSTRVSADLFMCFRDKGLSREANAVSTPYWGGKVWGKVFKCEAANKGDGFRHNILLLEMICIDL